MSIAAWMDNWEGQGICGVCLEWLREVCAGVVGKRQGERKEAHCSWQLCEGLRPPTIGTCSAAILWHWCRQFFQSGKTLPIERGAGPDQPVMQTVAREVARGRWLHIFPEVGWWLLLHATVLPRCLAQPPDARFGRGADLKRGARWEQPGWTGDGAAAAASAAGMWRRPDAEPPTCSPHAAGSGAGAGELHGADGGAAVGGRQGRLRRGGAARGQVRTVLAPAARLACRACPPQRLQLSPPSAGLDGVAKPAQLPHPAAAGTPSCCPSTTAAWAR